MHTKLDRAGLFGLIGIKQESNIFVTVVFLVNILELQDIIIKVTF